MPTEPPPLIDARLAVLLQAGVSMVVGACGADLQPTLARAFGCRISPDRRRVTLFISATQAASVLECIRQNGAIAVVFSRVTTYRTVQLKGTDATVDGLQPGDSELVSSYRSAFAHELAQLGYEQNLIFTLLFCPSDDIVSLSFTPSEAYSQTPGPKAGEPLKAEE